MVLQVDFQASRAIVMRLVVQAAQNHASNAASVEEDGANPVRLGDAGVRRPQLDDLSRGARNTDAILRRRGAVRGHQVYVSGDGLDVLQHYPSAVSYLQRANDATGKNPCCQAAHRHRKGATRIRDIDER